MLLLAAVTARVIRCANSLYSSNESKIFSAPRVRSSSCDTSLADDANSSNGTRAIPGSGHSRTPATARRILRRIGRRIFPREWFEDLPELLRKMLLEEDDEDEFEEVSVSMTMRSLDEESAMRSKALGAHGSGRIRRASLYLAAFHGEGHAAVGTPPARSNSGGKKPDPASRNSGEVSGGLDEKERLEEGAERAAHDAVGVQRAHFLRREALFVVVGDEERLGGRRHLRRPADAHKAVGRVRRQVHFFKVVRPDKMGRRGEGRRRGGRVEFRTQLSRSTHEYN